MKIKINKTIKNTAIQFEIDNPKIKDALFLAGSLASMPSECKLCGSSDVMLSSNKAKEYMFVKIICSKCGARSQMGEYKDGSGFYWKDWEKYIPKGGGRDENVPVIEEDMPTIEE